VLLYNKVDRTLLPSYVDIWKNLS